MATIKDWTVSYGRAELFTSEDGKRHLIRDDKGDIAEIKETPENIVIAIPGISIVINENKKEITILRR